MDIKPSAPGGMNEPPPPYDGFAGYPNLNGPPAQQNMHHPGGQQIGFISPPQPTGMMV